MESRYDSLRRDAIRIYGSILKDQQIFDSFSPVEPDSRGWIQEIVLGSLRYRTRIESLIRFYSKKQPPKLKAIQFLTLAGYQVLTAKEEHRAKAVSQWVELSKSELGKNQSGFVNFQLRRFADEKVRADFFSDEKPDWSESEFEWYCLPKWAYEKLKKEQGEAWVRDFALSSLEKPTTWKRNLAKVESSLYTAGSELADNEIIQGISSQKSVDLVSQSIDGYSGKTIIDVCAAPGGKAIAMAALGGNVTATDQNQRRLERVLENVNRVNLSINVKPFDEAFTGEYELVWVDAPCMAFGTLRKNPEAKWIRGEAKLNELFEVQIGILNRASGLCTDNGHLVYTVCSPFQLEGGTVVEHFLENHPDFKLDKKWRVALNEYEGAEGFQGFLLSKSSSNSS